MSTPRLTVDDLDALIAECQSDLNYAREHELSAWVASCKERLRWLKDKRKDREKDAQKEEAA